MSETEKMIRELYADFNRRDIPAALERLSPDVAWANGLEGGHVFGREAVRDYWTRQWAAIQPRVDPSTVRVREDGTLDVEVRQVVRDMSGNLLLDEIVRHVFVIQAGLVKRFDIEEAGGLSKISDR